MLAIMDVTLAPALDLEGPLGLKVLGVSPGPNGPILHVMGDPKGIMITHKFRTYKSGEQVPERPGEFVGTLAVPIDKKRAVYAHVFYEGLGPVVEIPTKSLPEQP